MATKIPASFSEYFWDVNFNTLDPTDSSFFIIKRILDRGNTTALKWLFDNYPEEKIKKTILETKDLSQKTANFWADVFGINKSQIACLQKPYSPTQFGLSS